MKKVYFVRHGLTEGNKTHVYQHPRDGLTEEGIAQARFVAERFTRIPIEVILSSTMTRAVQTAEEIAKTTGKEVVQTPLLCEVKRPTSVIGKSRLDPEYRAFDNTLYEQFGNPDWRHSDEENYFDLKERVESALSFVLEREEKTIAVILHGLILKMLLAVAVMGESLTYESYVKINSGFATFNTGITKITHDGDAWRVLAWNDHAHLGEDS